MIDSIELVKHGRQPTPCVEGRAKACCTRLVFRIFAVCVVWLSLLSMQANAQHDNREQLEKPKAVAPNDLPPVPLGMDVRYDGPTKKLLDQLTKKNWDKVDFAGGGDFRFDSDVLTIEAGEMLSGVYWDGFEFPHINYEISLEARRMRGLDFFCGLAFPVNDSHCCLIVGGWAGSTVGLSNIDDKDASSNDTTRLMLFDDKQWYKIRVRVLPERIITWIDGECVIYKNTVGKKISLRGDTDLLTPMGLCTFATEAQIRNMTLQRIISKTGAVQGKSKDKSSSSDKNIK